MNALEGQGIISILRENNVELNNFLKTNEILAEKGRCVLDTRMVIKIKQLINRNIAIIATLGGEGE